MYNGQKVVDVHGHMTTPAPFRQFLAETVSQNTPGRKLDMTDEQLENAQQRHLKFMDADALLHGAEVLNEGAP